MIRLGSICCSTCHRYLPNWMYAKARSGVSVTGREYACRTCRLKNPTRYSAEQTQFGKKLKPYRVSVWFRIKEALTP